MEADPGESVSYRAEPDSDYDFAGWRSAGGAVPCVEAGGETTWAGENCSFVVPAGGVDLTAEFVDPDPPKAPVVEDGPAGPVNRPPSFVFADPTVHDEDATFHEFRCAVGPVQGGAPAGDSFVPCRHEDPSVLGHTVTDTLPDGEHLLWVLAEDFYGNRSEPTAVAWTYDRVPPTVRFEDRPARYSTETTPVFGYWTDGAVKSCSLDGEEIPCQSIRVRNGRHTFVVTVEDAAKNTASASYTWQVDTVRPRVRRKAPTGRRVSRTANVTLFFSEPMQKALVVRRGKPAVQLLQGRKRVAATVRYVRRGRTYRAILDPKRRLRARTAYRVVVTALPKDLAGNTLRPTGWRFRTR
ncbi:Ig-like domain-containing protein [Nocardioides sp. TF02-7]|nr:Ig-like domain-containing protein [Nocardioides sp. TF02-7]UMG94699.1 Ig-like domain-containing protein [Nocardioides sp. TF02-7]